MFLDNLKVLQKFLCTVKISYQAILQIRGSKSGAGADTHPFLNWWSLTCTLSSAIFPLKLRIVWSDTSSGVSYFCVACVFNDCHRKNQSRRSKMGLTSDLSDAYNDFSSSCFSFFYWVRLRFLQWIRQWRFWFRVHFRFVCFFMFWTIRWLCKLVVIELSHNIHW